MNDFYEVVPPELTAHARKLSGLADELQQAQDSTGNVSVTHDAFGQTCEQLATVLQNLGGAGRVALQNAVDALTLAQTNLRKTAETFEQRETETASGFHAIDATQP